MYLEKNLKKEKDNMLNQGTKEAPSKNTTDKEDPNSLQTILKELPQLLVTHAYTKLKSGDELTASEMKVCLEVCKTYSTEPLTKKEDNILDDIPFDTDGQ
tara:strand:+ start:1448 stop:1747 length:300 start_codon:yes stop_codon:yes gene_type:complete